MELDVRNVTEQSRYEVQAEGDLAGFAEYLLKGERMIFTHTEVEPRFEGQGVGSALIRGALDDVRRRNLTADARCSFVRAWLDRHPEYADVERGAQQ